ncbi:MULTISPECIES: hypothetical protein [Amycolatopsis]|uniref:Uncharacterized protein n=1 Tax=Amycolatopsis saalfeldensis TaxID=394193 RepID=A0A1H8YPC4_9PSEU|nr:MULTISPECIES: hypothetical protein [Amycolatopsis]SEP54064.1 hypothetical protein SAMN04489732_13621 [Amycolatopsis saalfeldensis]
MSDRKDRDLLAVPWRSAELALALAGLALMLVAGVRTRWEQARASGDQGSESVEKAVIAAVCLAVAIGLVAAIKAVVVRYQGQLQ